jgi:hypothetical protein
LVDSVVEVGARDFFALFSEAFSLLFISQECVAVILDFASVGAVDSFGGLVDFRNGEGCPMPGKC